MSEEYLYNKPLKPLANQLRNNSTFGEVILWSKVLRARKMSGYQFNRQYSMQIDELSIIVNFICRELKLIIEVDGYSHNFKYDQDILRDEKLAEKGYKVLRFSERDVKSDLGNVIRVIENFVAELELKKKSNA
jgi:very-short-patch-repair endonuclease